MASSTCDRFPYLHSIFNSLENIGFDYAFWLQSVAVVLSPSRKRHRPSFSCLLPTPLSWHPSPLSAASLPHFYIRGFFFHKLSSCVLWLFSAVIAHHVYSPFKYFILFTSLQFGQPARCQKARIEAGPPSPGRPLPSALGIPGTCAGEAGRSWGGTDGKTDQSEMWRPL